MCVVLARRSGEIRQRSGDLSCDFSLKSGGISRKSGEETGIGKFSLLSRGVHHLGLRMWRVSQVACRFFKIFSARNMLEFLRQLPSSHNLSENLASKYLG